jgi:hypothetical protein
MMLTAFTAFHVAVSLIGIGAAFVIREDPEEGNVEGLSGPSAWYGHDPSGPN